MFRILMKFFNCKVCLTWYIGWWWDTQYDRLKDDCLKQRHKTSRHHFSSINQSWCCNYFWLFFHRKPLFVMSWRVFEIFLVTEMPTTFELFNTMPHCCDILFFLFALIFLSHKSFFSRIEVYNAQVKRLNFLSRHLLLHFATLTWICQNELEISNIRGEMVLSFKWMPLHHHNRWFIVIIKNHYSCK